jgi:hypothetical protein
MTNDMARLGDAVSRQALDRVQQLVSLLLQEEKKGRVLISIRLADRAD